MLAYLSGDTQSQAAGTLHMSKMRHATWLSDLEVVVLLGSRYSGVQDEEAATGGGAIMTPRASDGAGGIRRIELD